MREGKRSMKSWLAAVATGAGVAYLFDPQLGRSRRTRMRDQAQGAVRRGKTRAERLQRRVEAETYGLEQKLAHPIPENTTPDDITLKQKIESEVLGWGDVPKASINVTVVDGVVELRGQCGTPEQMKRIERDVRKIVGVMNVTNMMHLPKTPAPNKEPARQASIAATTDTGTAIE